LLGKCSFDATFQKPCLFCILSCSCFLACFWIAMYAWTRIFLVATIASLCWIVGCYVFVCSYATRYSSNRNFGPSTRSLSSGWNPFDYFGLGSIVVLVSTCIV